MTEFDRFARSPETTGDSKQQVTVTILRLAAEQ